MLRRRSGSHSISEEAEVQSQSVCSASSQFVSSPHEQLPPRPIFAICDEDFEKL